MRSSGFHPEAMDLAFAETIRYSVKSSKNERIRATPPP